MNGARVAVAGIVADGSWTEAALPGHPSDEAYAGGLPSRAHELWPPGMPQSVIRFRAARTCERNEGHVPSTVVDLRVPFYRAAIPPMAQAARAVTNRTTGQ